MDHRIDEPARQMVERAPRRQALMGLGALALGSVGLLSLNQAAEAKKCRKRCKDHCRNQRNSKQAKKNCRNRCRNQCG